MGFLNKIGNKLGDFAADFATGSANKLQKEVEEFAAKPLEERQNLISQTYENVTDFLGVNPSSVETAGNTSSSTNVGGISDSTQSTESSTTSENESGNSSPAAGAYLVCNGAMCTCNYGAVPMVKIPITTHKKYYANDKLAATIKDKNLLAPFFGKCNLKSPPGDVSCTYVPADWVIKKGDGHPTAGGVDILIDNGEIACPIGGKITIVNHGQQTTVSNKDVGGFSVDAAPAVCCLLPISTIVKEGEEKNEGTKAGVGHIICGEQKSNTKVSIIERASEQLVFEASTSGNPNLISWAVKKEGNKDWSVFARYGKKIPLTFNEGSKYTVVAFGRSPDTFKFNSSTTTGDKGCYFNVEAIKENKLTHIEINGTKVAGGKSFFIGEVCSIVPKFKLPLNDEEQAAFILEVKNGDNDVSQHMQRGDAPYSLPTDQETKYKIYAHYDGEINPESIVVIEIAENSVSNITPDEKFARHGERRTFGVELRNKNNINPGKIHWKVNGLEQQKGKNLTYAFPMGTTDKNYKIEASYGGIFTERNVATRVVTTKLNTINKILISDINSGQSGVVGGSYTIKADAVIPYLYLKDSPIKWKVILLPTDMKTAMNTDLKAIFRSPVNSDMKEFIHEFSTTNTMQFTPHIEGTYTIVAELNGKTSAHVFVVKQSEVKTWRFVDSNGWTLRQLGMKHPFNIELEVEGWANKEITLSLFIQYGSALGKTREVLLGKHTTNASGTITPIAIDANHQLWKDVEDITTGKYIGYDIQKVNLVVAERVYPYKTMQSVKSSLALYLPEGKGDMIQPTVKVCKSLSFEGRFADSENNTLRKILKYGEPARAQIRILNGYSSDESTQEKYLFTLFENKSLGDKEIDDFKKKEVELKSGEDIIDIPIDTDKLGKDTHVKDKKTASNPRLFYFLLEEKGRFVDPDKLTYPTGLADTRNDETLIELEVHDGKNDAEIDKRNEKKIKDTGSKDRYDYFNQLKVAAETTLNKSLENKAMAIIGEPLTVEKNKSIEGGCPRCKELITFDQLRKIFDLKYDKPKEQQKYEERIKTVVEIYNKYMTDFDMATCWNKAHFFAQARIEVGRSLQLREPESLNYSTRALLVGTYTEGQSDWKKGDLVTREGGYYQKGTKFQKPLFSYFLTHEQEANDIGRKDLNKNNDKGIQACKAEKLANIVYADKNRAENHRLGNTQEGDGWLFRGRGMIQVTGRELYEKTWKLIKEKEDATKNITTKEGTEEITKNLKLAMLVSMGAWKVKTAVKKSNGCKDANIISTIIGSNVDHAGKKKVFDDITSKLFKVTDCQWGKVSFIATDLITYHIYHDRRIEKHIPKNSKQPNHRKYVYHDAKGVEYVVSVLECIEVPFVTLKGVIASVPKNHNRIWTHDTNENVDAETSYYYNDKNGKLDKIVVKPKAGSETTTILQYDIDKTKKIILVKMIAINVVDNLGKILAGYDFIATERYYAGEDQYASFIGLLFEFRVSWKGTGNTHIDGTGFPSRTHVNGCSFDFRYSVQMKEDGVTEDYDQKLIDAMHNWGYKPIYTGLGKRTYTHTKKIAGHNHHIHCGPLKSVTLIEVKEE